MFKIALFYDANSKRMSSIDSSVLNSSEITIVDSLLDLDVEELDENRIVVILEGAATDSVIAQDLKLFKKLLGINYLFLLGSKEVAEFVSGLGKVFLCKTNHVDYELVQAGLFSDKAYYSAKKGFSDSKDFAERLLKESSDEEVCRLAREYLSAISYIDLQEQNYQKQKDAFDQLASVNHVLELQNKNWRDGCLELVRRVCHQNDMLSRYETVLTTDIYSKVNLRNYADKPTVIYLKLFTDFIGLHSFIETIVDTMKFQARKSVKVLQLFDGSGDRRMRMFPEYYHKLHNFYTMQEVINNNYLVKSGNYTNLLDRILTNKYGLDVLVIVDNKDHDDCVLTGSFLQYNLCRTVTQATALALPQNRTVVNQKVKGWLNWIPVNLNDMSQKEKLIKLSSRRIIQHVLELSDKYANAF